MQAGNLGAFGRALGEASLSFNAAANAVLYNTARGVCAHCLESDNLEHFVASGRGEVYTFTVTEQNQAKGFAEACPYVMAYVTLEEGLAF